MKILHIRCSAVILFTDEFIKRIVDESNLYAFQKNPNNTFTVKPIEIEQYFGVLLYSSVVKVNAVRDYWCPFVGASLVNTSISSKKFEKIRGVLHFNDNNTMVLDAKNPNYDRLHKLRPVLDYFNSCFELVPYEHNKEIYSGQEYEARFRAPEEPDLGECANIVVRLARKIPKFCNCRLYYDNYYTTLPLLVYLHKYKEISSLGIIRKNRIKILT